MPEKHAKYSPSTLKSYRACPGYLNAQDGDNSAADAGSLCHALVEHDLDIAAARSTNPKLDSVELTDELLSLATMAYEYSSALINEAEKCKSLKAVHKELWLDLRPLGLAGCNGGTADLVVLHKDNTVDLIDYKFGMREVDRIQDDETGELINMQFMTYALGVMLKWPKTKAVRVHMVQPKLEIADTGTVTPKHTPAITALIEETVRNCHEFERTKDASMLRPDSELCGWCARQSTCPKWVGAAISVAHAAAKHGIPESDKEFDPELIPRSFTGWDPEEADPVEVAKMMKTLAPLESFIRRYKQFALQVNLLPGKSIPGYAQVDSSGKTTVISPLDAMLILEQKFGVTREEFVAVATVSLDACKKLVSSKAARGEKGRLVEELVETLSDEGILEQAPGFSYLKATRTKIVD